MRRAAAEQLQQTHAAAAQLLLNLQLKLEVLAAGVVTSVGSNPEAYAASWQAASKGLDQSFSVASTTAESRLTELRTARRRAEQELVANHVTHNNTC